MATYIRLVDYKDPVLKEKEFFNRENCYFFNKERYCDIPGSAISYHISDRLFEIFKDFPQVKDISDPKVGLQTGKNDVYYREWHEVDFNKISFNSEKSAKWYPCIKGGDARKWYGNFGTIINWENDGSAVKNQSGSVIRNSSYYFRKGLTWTKITSNFALRYYPEGMIMTDASVFVFPEEEKLMMACLNSRIMPEIICALNPTLNFVASTVAALPMVYPDNIEEVKTIVSENIDIVKKDWDESEYSWNFDKSALLNYQSNTISNAIRMLLKDKEEQEKRLINNEVCLDIIFADLYQIEIDKNDVPEESNSIRHYTEGELVRALISYAVGCIMGRYSLKEDGLIYAGGEWDDSRYADNFKPCEYGVMLITEEQYFEEDLCTRVIDFIEVVYGKDTLNENLAFIANALKPGSKESPRQVLRNYLYDEKGFFENHYQIYQHRPIYWMMSSGKNGGFRAVIYMHRYNQNTLSIVRSEFLHELRYKYEADQTLQHKKEIEATSTVDRNEAKKKITSLDKKVVEVNQYDDLVNHATGDISSFLFDLDDGVKKNYSKFLNIDGIKTQNLLVPIKL